MHALEATAKFAASLWRFSVETAASAISAFFLDQADHSEFGVIYLPEDQRMKSVFCSAHFV